MTASPPKPLRIAILGAGVIGVTNAWYLRAAGHDVVVIDRQPGAGLETSFANGGQISVSHAEPWANPAAPWQVLRWLFRHDAPLLFRLRLDPALWRWGLQFLRECLPSRSRANTAQLVRLGLYSRDQLDRLRRETGIENDHLACGILHFFTDRASFQHAAETAALMRAQGCDLALKTAQECLVLEPVLQSIAGKLVGATFTPSDQSGDAHLFTRRLAELARGAGAEFRYDTAVQAIDHEADRVTGVRVRHADREQRIVADCYVMALGSYSARLLRPLGVTIPVYPAKGYSLTLPITDPARAPVVSLIDESLKIVVSRLGERLRVAGTAEFNGYDLSIDRRRCDAILRRALELFPGAFDPTSAQCWAGLRPATPGNVPLIGRTRLRNLYLNTGHGTLGWTLACGSACALTDLIEGRAPAVALPALQR